MKVLATIAALALATHYVSAECNNMCSGHGICGANDACTCYRNWRGNDCSERTCQFGVAFVDTAQGDLDHDGLIKVPPATASDLILTQWAPSGTFEEYFKFATAEEGHAYMECSNKGLCDRSSGECVCFDGYEGSACQRTVCPNSCNGNGVCRNIVDKSQALSAASKYSYPLWDGLKNQACVCDPGYSGVDCAQRDCPKGADPLIDEIGTTAVTNEVQTITFNSVADGTFRIYYTDLFGERWRTAAITMDADGDAATATNVKNAMTGIPNSVIEDITVSCTAPACTLTFTHNPGDLVAVEVPTSEMTSGMAGKVATITTPTPGTTVATECSGRGLCDRESGLCKCFRGYRLDDCSSQHALSYGGSAISA